MPSYLPETEPATLWPASDEEEICRVLTFNVIPKELVSRLIVRLHKRLTFADCWRYGLYVIRGQVRALLRVDTEPAAAETSVLAGRLPKRDKLQPKNSLHFLVKGDDVEGRSQLMSEIVCEITVCVGNYPGVVMHQNVRSPLNAGSLINLDVVTADFAKGPKERSLACPRTKQPLDSERLLFGAGILAHLTAREIGAELRKSVRGVRHDGCAL